MAALPARIGFILNGFRRAVATTPLAKARYGALARESSDPVETYFDNVTDAAIIATERQALLSAERRRFKVSVRDLDAVVDIDFIGGLPVVQYVDRERGVDRPMLASEIVFDFGRQSAAMTVWG